VTVQRFWEVPKAAHFESTPEAKPQSGSLGAPAEVQSLELNSFNAVHVLALSEQISAVWPSILLVPVTTFT
jgi:hypothetical protein